LLQREVQHPDSLVRRRAAIALGRLGDRAGTSLLLRLLDDADSTVRIEAVFALGQLGDAAAVGELAARAARFPRVVTGDLEAEVVAALAKIGGPDAERALAAILEAHPATGGASDDRATATVLLEAWRLGRRSSLAPRLTAYVRSSRGAWRQNAVFSATRMRLPQAADALLEAATDPDPLTRAWVARGLLAAVADSGGVPRGAFVSRLRALAADSAAPVRINALRALASYADSSLAAVAVSRLVDRDANVPVQAALTLGMLGGSRAAEALAERVVGAPSFGLRRAALLGLAQAAPARAIEAARQWRSDPDWRLRAAYAEMLGAAATPASRVELMALCADQEPRVVGVALGALDSAASAGDTAVLALARARLGHADPIVRATATGMLAHGRSRALIREFAQAYRRAEADPLSDARLAAVHALSEIGQAGPDARAEVEAAFLAAFPRSGDYLVRRAVAEDFGAATYRRYWGAVGPVETGRSAEDYREIARRYVLGEAPAGNLTIETERGDLVIQMYSADAPLTVDNFVRLVERRFFDNGRWHRVVPNFVIQDGDPRGDGSGGPGTSIRDEVNRQRYGRGTVGMALSGPDTGGSQFFITHAPQPHLDGTYTVFGFVVSGWDVLDQIVQGDRIRRIFH
jgi:cyclophilin family peptidyl-prolyl cis-trans isomerase/HEAT repeat protein